MTHQAPPSLINDSLSAAMDEVRHAKVSFEIASLLRNGIGQSPIEPGPLPSSTHQFDTNLSELVVRTAREGCIDETLSALSAALEADYYVQPATNTNVDNDDEMGLSSFLQDKMNVIAMEEGNHSILAWRTIHWACHVGETSNPGGQDDTACKAARELFDSELVVQAAKSRLSKNILGVNREELEQEWERICETLIPLVTMRGSSLDVNSLIDCNKPSSMEEQSVTDKTGVSTIRQLTDKIIRGVHCSVVQGIDVAKAA